jgi:hypothetical protein
MLLPISKVIRADPIGRSIWDSNDIGGPQAVRRFQPPEVEEGVIRPQCDQPLVDRLPAAHEAIQIEVKHQNIAAVATPAVEQAAGNNLRNYIHPSLRQVTPPGRISDRARAVASNAHHLAQFTRTCADC